MSDTLLEFANPVLEIPNDAWPDEVKTALMFAALVWNAVLAAKGDIESVVKELPPKIARTQRDSREVISEMVEKLARRKLARFSHDRRLIAGIDTYWGGDQVRILAASTFAEM